MIKRLIFFTAVAVMSIPSVSMAQSAKSTLDDQTTVEVTVYNSNLGLIKDTRNINLPKGIGELQFMDVAATIRPVTVSVKSLNAPNQFMVLEQNYEYDLMNSQKLLDKYVGKQVKIIDENMYQGTQKEISAELLSNNNGQIYKIGGEIYLGYNGKIVLPEIPENLIANPTLTWMYKNELADAQQLEVSYLADQINWVADYVMMINNDDTSAGLSGWVTLDNKSGTEYRNAKLKLVAGDINRVQDQNLYLAKANMVMESMADRSGGFQEETFFEYHMYDLQRPTTIKNNQTKQINLLSADGIRVEKEFMVSGQQHYYQSRYPSIPESKVSVYLKFKNETANQLGMPLPAGVIRLYKADSQGKLQLVGEDQIKHTPKNEEITLKIGDAFDVIAERKQMDFQNIGTRAMESEWEVTLRNHKDEDIIVTVIEPVWGEWSVINSSHTYEKMDAQNIKFRVPVSKNDEAKLKYRVRVSFR